MTPAGDLRRALGFWSGTALVVGTMIGSGIFRTPASIATVLQNPLLILGMWVFFGAVCICGALTVAELATMLPRTGGTYVYLRAAYGDGAAFVFGWLYLLVAIPSGIAASSVFFGELTLRVFGILPHEIPWGIPAFASLVIVVLSAINIAGVRQGAAVHNTFTVIKVSALIALIVGALLSQAGEVQRWYMVPAEFKGGFDGVATSAKSVLFTYTGWIYVTLVGGELHQPERRLSRVILTGTITVSVLYVSANLAYLYLIPMSSMGQPMIAREAMMLIAGPVGAAVMNACILASVFGGLNGVILTKARVAYAQARDGLSFAFLGRAHPTRATPHYSIMIQGAGAIVLVVALHNPLHPLRLFDRLTAYFVLVEWLALVFGVAAIFVLRRTMPDAPRPYRTPGYPFVPIFFIAGTLAGLAALLWSAFSTGDLSPLVGVAIVILGFPVYWIWRRYRAHKP
ncbi:MAG: amino acid permease [Verrucomicrobia bacterium]|nr:amino acid permease [Verrucomicrobiota bacterium]